MFWRQATNARILVDATGKALVYASAGSEYNDCCIAYRSDSDTVAVAEIVMVEGIDNWGSTEITVSTADNVRSFTVDGTTYSFTDGQAITPAVTEYVPIPIAVAGVAQLFADEGCSMYLDDTDAISGQHSIYMRVNQDIPADTMYLDSVSGPGNHRLEFIEGELDALGFWHAENVNLPLQAGQIVEIPSAYAYSGQPVFVANDCIYNFTE